ncbi:MAG: hypothetical protein JWO22_3547 [Frankiales bacterium]|nr:hypothetical protein [Frankiales bacterium]
MKSYEGPGVVVGFDADVCQHAAMCVRGLPRVFDTGARPWIQPANATVAEVVSQVEMCSSGALSVQVTDGSDGQP